MGGAEFEPERQDARQGDAKAGWGRAQEPAGEGAGGVGAGQRWAAGMGIGTPMSAARLFGAWSGRLTSCCALASNSITNSSPRIFGLLHEALRFGQVSRLKLSGHR